METRLTCDFSVAPHFLPAIGLSIPGRCLLIQPVGSTDWWLWAHVLVPLVAKALQPGGSMSLSAKTKGTKWGWPPHALTQCAWHCGCLPGRPSQDSPAHVPNGTNLAQSIGDAQPPHYWDPPSGHIAERSCWFEPLALQCGPLPICCRGAPGASKTIWRTS